MEELKVVKSYVDETGHAVIICPYCFRKRSVRVNKFRGRHSASKVRCCACSQHFKVILEFRQHYRKETMLDCKFQINPPAKSGGICEIINLSTSGLCFRIRGVHDIQAGQIGSVTFTLDNHKRSELTKRIIVRHVEGKHIGCEFLDHEEYEKELGFYLRP